ncbi:DUF4871 domain-containing protein [Fictibacillus phosphorivorans]|uniref:DUF4871 domain-containing protein n=1 Tax=Fictibacillus phosphorivorans TaxID=1221500 RepID=UPI002040B0D7|nr:DUF4871 domain-containing protein [Fictibacillus phosphorivorans]MCM3718323.1 DUF4871 domain-containing protein [Fictibacillus phosphorivorans]MCM3775813.1 DUF4871 domain-containing protein [Fictibacillus phosphorivorans]
MKKKLLALSLFLTIGIMAACTPSSKTAKDLEKPKEKNEAQESTNEIKEITSEGNWDLSLTFDHSVVYESGEKGSYEIVGNKDTVGFTGPFPIKEKDSQKYFWFYFGKENVYDKPVKVKAIKKGTKELVDILSGPSTFYESAEVSPDSVNMPSHLRFPSAGVWKVLIYIDEKLYEDIVVEVV